MKIIVLHGEDNEKSYQRLKSFIDAAKKRSWEVTYVDPSGAGLGETLSGTSLFGGERFFVLRDTKSLGKKDFTWLEKKSAHLTGNLVIHSESTLSPTFLKSLPDSTKVEEFKLPKLIWNFLEHLFPGNAAVAVKEFHKIVESEAPEFVFSLIARQMRDLYWVRSDEKSTAFPPWKIGKLRSQASKFSEDKLKEIISELSIIDVSVKTGKAALTTSLDLLVIKQLQ